MSESAKVIQELDSPTDLKPLFGEWHGTTTIMRSRILAAAFMVTAMSVVGQILGLAAFVPSLGHRHGVRHEPPDVIPHILYFTHSQNVLETKKPLEIYNNVQSKYH